MTNRAPHPTAPLGRKTAHEKTFGGAHAADDPSPSGVPAALQEGELLADPEQESSTAGALGEHANEPQAYACGSFVCVKKRCILHSAKRSGGEEAICRPLPRPKKYGSSVVSVGEIPA